MQASGLFPFNSCAPAKPPSLPRRQSPQRDDRTRKADECTFSFAVMRKRARQEARPRLGQYENNALSPHPSRTKNTYLHGGVTPQYASCHCIVCLVTGRATVAASQPLRPNRRAATAAAKQASGNCCQTENACLPPKQQQQHLASFTPILEPVCLCAVCPVRRNGEHQEGKEEKNDACSTAILGRTMQGPACLWQALPIELIEILYCAWRRRLMWLLSGRAASVAHSCLTPTEPSAMLDTQGAVGI